MRSGTARLSSRHEKRFSCPECSRAVPAFRITRQAAGTAAAIARKHATGPRGVYENYVKELQQTLLRDGCHLLGVRDEDPTDLALGGAVTASSSAPGAEPEKAVNGWNRVVGRDRNAWAPAEGAPGPHRLEIELARPVSVAEVHVTFEQKSVPCRVEARTDGGWRKVAEIAPRSLRRNVLRFAPLRASAVRLVAEGAAPAVCEVRVYE
ncbi:MAG: discoidin domain-containing protein [Planctomycetota bacterium]